MSFVTQSSLQVKASNAKPHAPLSDAELDTLADLLAMLGDAVDLDSAEETIETEEPSLPLSLDAVDGLFAALAISPRNMPIAQWMAIVTGSARFADKVQTQLCRTLLIRHHQSVVHLLRHTDMADYYPCVSFYEAVADDPSQKDVEDKVDVRAWCLGFSLGYFAQKAAWDARLDDMALTELHLMLALKDVTDTSEWFAEDEHEAALRMAQQALISEMRTQVSALLQEPADDLMLIIFVLHGLRDHLLAAEQQAKQHPRTSPVKNGHHQKHR